VVDGRRQLPLRVTSSLCDIAVGSSRVGIVLPIVRIGVHKFFATVLNWTMEDTGQRDKRTLANLVITQMREPLGSVGWSPSGKQRHIERSECPPSGKIRIS